MSSSTGTPDGEPVYLHVYDLSMGMAASMSAAFLGVSLPYIPHTGIVAWQHEFFYSGGISVLKPHVVVQTFGLAPIQKVLLGHTRKGEQELRVFLRSISHRFTADKYDLFRHNCNNFTAEVAKFLFGDAVPTSYPSIILEIPNIVLSTPMGASIGQMLSQNDPFAAMRNGGGPAGLATAASAFMSSAGTSGSGSGGSGSGSGAAASPATPNAAFEAALNVVQALAKDTVAILENHSASLLSENPGSVAGVVERLIKISDTMLPDESPHRLTKEEKETLNELPAVLAGAKSTSSSSSSSSAFASSATERACLIAAKIHRCWPRSQAAFPVLALLRLLILRGECASVLIESGSGGGVLWDVAEAVACSGGLPASTASPLPSGVTAASSEGEGGAAIMYGHYSSDVMALSCLANAFKVPALATWATKGSVFTRLVDSVCRVLSHEPAPIVAPSTSPSSSPAKAPSSSSASSTSASTPLTGGASQHHPYARPELRAMAAALAFNLALTMKVGSDTISSNSAAGGSTTEGDATTVVTDASVQLLSALLDGNLTKEKDGEAQKRRLLAAGRILIREGEACATLAVTLGLDETVRVVANDVTLQGPSRIVAKEILTLLSKATAAASASPT